jgi:hypothetical protein
MTKLCTLLVAILAGSASYLVASFLMTTPPAPPTTPPERFPILSRFELPRDYGHFIGDAIPLRLLIETASGVVLDLGHLPQKGEKHGIFEIRDLQLTTSTSVDGGKVYYADYTLQYFGATPLIGRFEPLDILYALPTDRAALTKTYSYKSLLTQPVAIHIARMGPDQPRPSMDIKGPINVSRVGIIRTSLTTGAMLLLIAIGGGGREWHRARQHRRACRAAALTPTNMILAVLRQESDAWYPAAEPGLPGVIRLHHLLRQYLHDALGLPANTLTTTELAVVLYNKPFYKDILYLLERCDTLKYQAPTDTSVEERQLWWEAMTLFEKLQKDDAP